MLHKKAVRRVNLKSSHQKKKKEFSSQERKSCFFISFILYLNEMMDVH